MNRRLSVRAVVVHKGKLLCVRLQPNGDGPATPRWYRRSAGATASPRLGPDPGVAAGQERRGSLELSGVTQRVFMQADP